MQIIALDTTTPQLRAPPSGSTYSAPRAIVMTPETLTGSAATSSLSIAQTWNTTGTPTAIDLNVTDTASNASSLLMNLRVGGSSRFGVLKDGNVFLQSSSANTHFIANSNGGGLACNNSGVNDGTYEAIYAGYGPRLGSNATLVWVSGATMGAGGGAVDVSLVRDAANTLALRNGVNAQESRVYGTFTDASNHRRLAMGMSAGGTAFIRPEGAGTGATGNVIHISGLPTSNPGPGILWNNAGTPAIGT